MSSESENSLIYREVTRSQAWRLAKGHTARFLQMETRSHLLCWTLSPLLWKLFLLLLELFLYFFKTTTLLQRAGEKILLLANLLELRNQKTALRL